jgi:hypothetical protein
MMTDSDPDTLHLLKSQGSSLKRIEELVDVSEEFKDTVRFVAHRTIANQHVNLYLYQVPQLSELGTGFGSSFEDGGHQSDRRDDVVLHFITEMCGIPCTIRIRGEDLSIWGRSRDNRRSAPFPALTHGNRAALAGVLDDLLSWWWNNG